MITVMADSHTHSLYAEQLADALRADGADVYLDEGFANTLLSRILSGGAAKWIVHVRGRTSVAVRNRYTNSVTSEMNLQKFLNNWRDYVD